MRQRSFTDIEYSVRKHKTRREAFLSQMDSVIPWDDWVALIRPYYPSGRRGRPVRGIETMLRMYLIQNWFSLSDKGVEDAVYDSYSMRSFVGVDLSGSARVPDATTLCRFRSLLAENGFDEYFRESIKKGVDESRRQRLEYVGVPKDLDGEAISDQITFDAVDGDDI